MGGNPKILFFVMFWYFPYFLLLFATFFCFFLNYFSLFFLAVIKVGSEAFGAVARIGQPRTVEGDRAPLRRPPIFRAAAKFFFLFLFFARPFLKFGPLHPSLFSRCARSRLNSFETLDLKIFGKKIWETVKKTVLENTVKNTRTNKENRVKT